MDESSVFHKVTITKETWDGNNPGNVSGQDMIRAFSHAWLDHYYKPKVLRVDAEGALASSESLGFCDSLSIRVEPIAGEAPW